ncbi:MAG: HEAT repeat domain-containing protein [Elusimicrobia bacterium]|nr:HEAT repeat domain-containing protein [Elusimicrobiota bacterium]
MSLEGDFRCSRAGSSLAAGGVKSALLGKDRKYAPDRAFDTLHVRLELAVDVRAKTLEGTCFTTVKAIKDGVRRLEFDAGGMKILGAALGAQKLKFSHSGERLGVTLTKTLGAGQDAEVAVRYRVVAPQRGFHFVAPSRETPAAPVQGWSQGQPEDAHWWFPCHDSPHEKATTEVIARVPKGFKAVSNGVLLGRKSVGGRDSFHWRMNHPHSLYLVSLCVGRFAEVVEKWEDVPVIFYCERGREEDAKRGFSKTVAALELFSKSFGVRYPYESYSQVAVSEFPGGMENTTCTTQTDAALIDAEAAADNDVDTLVAHELAHQWFGDLVTCRDWSHAWLNEGFATYCEYIFTEHDKGKDEADRDFDGNKRSYFDEDAHRYRRPVVCATYKHPWVLFDRHLYDKGGWVLHMLRKDLGEEAWKRSISHYLRRFRDQSVETGDFIAAIEAASGRNMRRFFDQWVFGAGYPSFEVRHLWNAAKGSAELRVKQGSDVFEVPVTFRFTGKDGRWTKDFHETVKDKEHTYTWKLPGAPAMVEVDPEHRLLKKLDLKKPLGLWRAQLTDARSGLSRSQAAFALSRWGDAASVRALETVARRDKFWGAAADAASSLGNIRSDGSRQALERLLAVEHPKVRRAVVSALSGWADSRSAKVLGSFAKKDPSIHVRGEALRALGRAREPQHLAELRAAAKRPSYWGTVATGALQGLSLSRDPRVLPDLIAASKAPTGYPQRAHAIRSLGTWYQTDDSLVNVIAASLNSADERIVMAAISTLGETGDRRALTHLEKIRDKSPDTRLKTYALEAITKIKGDDDSKK